MTDAPMYRDAAKIVRTAFDTAVDVPYMSQPALDWVKVQMHATIEMAQAEVSDYLAAERVRLTKERNDACLALKELTSAPNWSCSDCGAARSSGGKFIDVTSGNPMDGPLDHDVACVTCRSVETAESPIEALSRCVREREKLEDAAEHDAFWRGVYPDGLTAEGVRNELHDFHAMMEEVPKVYDHVTGGRCSKPLTHAVAVIGEHDEHCHETCVEREDVEAVVAELRELPEEWRSLSCGERRGQPGGASGGVAYESCASKLREYLADFDTVIGHNRTVKTARALKLELLVAKVALTAVRDDAAALLTSSATRQEWWTELPQAVTAIRDRAADGVKALDEALAVKKPDETAA